MEKCIIEVEPYSKEAEELADYLNRIAGETYIGGYRYYLSDGGDCWEEAEDLPNYPIISYQQWKSQKSQTMSKFKYSISVKVTEQQAKEIIPELHKLGYDAVHYSWQESNPWLITNWTGDNGRIGFSGCISIQKTYVSDTCNKDLIIALAAMREGDEFYPGEIVYWTEDYAPGYEDANNAWFRKGDLGRVISVDLPIIELVPLKKRSTTASGGFAPGKFRKATKEEIINFYSGKEEKAKYTIEELKKNTHIVVECTTLEQLNKVASAFTGKPENNTRKDCLPAVVWYKSVAYPQEGDGYNFNVASSLYSWQFKIDFDQVIFPEEKKEEVDYTGTIIMGKDSGNLYRIEKANRGERGEYVLFCLRTSRRYAYGYDSKEIKAHLNAGTWIIQENKQEELPEEYLIDCTGITVKEMNEYIKHPDAERTGWAAGWSCVKFPFERNKYWFSLKSALEGNNLPIIPFREWKEKINKQSKEKTMEKEIIGYKLVKKEFEKAARAIHDAYAPNGSKNADFAKGSCAHNAFERAGVMHWFEPVYKEEIKEVKLRVGTPAKEITITSKGEIKQGGNMIFMIQQVSELFRQTEEGTMKLYIGGGGDPLPVYVTNFFVGCPTQGTNISKNDLSLIIRKYNELNPPQK